MSTNIDDCFIILNLHTDLILLKRLSSEPERKFLKSRVGIYNFQQLQSTKNDFHGKITHMESRNVIRLFMEIEINFSDERGTT